MENQFEKTLDLIAYWETLCDFQNMLKDGFVEKWLNDLSRVERLIIQDYMKKRRSIIEREQKRAKDIFKESVEGKNIIPTIEDIKDSKN